jgi:hypothetical protein
MNQNDDDLAHLPSFDYLEGVSQSDVATVPTATTQLLAAGSTKHDAEVEGRSSDELLPEQKTALTQLASGKADNGARLKLIPLLRSNRNALAYLGEQMKLLRPGTTRKPRAG